MRAIDALFFFVIVVATAAATARAERVFVKNVPYHRQVLNVSCGSASLCMAIEHAWGRALQAEGALDQLAVVDVARTDSQVGIFVHDVPRVARFSVLSGCPAGDPLFPAHAPKAGWWGADSALPMGLGTVHHCETAAEKKQRTCWIPQLRKTLAAGVPVVVLMSMEEADLGGHFRVVVGFDDAKDSVTLLDPWDREWSAGRTPRLIEWPTDIFCKLWAYEQDDSNGSFCGTAIAAWDFDLALTPLVFDPATGDSDNQTRYELLGTVRVPLADMPGARTEPEHAAAGCTFALAQLPSTVVLVEGDPQQPIGTLAPGDTAQARWVVKDIGPDATIGPHAPRILAATASGIVKGSLPAYRHWQPYSYTDAIGATGTVILP